MDITNISAVGAKIPLAVLHGAQRLKCNYPRMVQRCNLLLEKHLQENGVFTRLDKLFHTYKGPLTKEQQSKLEDRDRCRVRGMRLEETM